VPAPGIDIRLFDAAVYSPQVTDAIVGMIGPATKGPTNRIIDFTDEGNFVNAHGRPADQAMYGPRAAIRYLHRGNKLKYVRIAGRNLATATLVMGNAAERKDILLFEAASSGSWANDGALAVAITLNGTPLTATTYNVFIYFQGQLVESFLSLDNGIVVSKINNGSTRVQVALAVGAGATLPDSTVNVQTGALDRVSFGGGDDGAFAKTDSIYSSTAGVAGKRFYGKMDAVAGSRVFQNLLTIGTSLAAKTVVYGSVGTSVVPGSFTIRVQTAAGPTFVELSDSGDLTYAPGGAGLGLLEPAAGTHTGFIDYRTGAWGVKLTAGSTFLTGTIDAIWMRASSESVGATAAGVGSYAGNLSAFPCGVGYYSANKAVISVPVDEQVGVHVAGGASSGSATSGLKTLAGWIIPGTVVITPTHPTLAVPSVAYDDGFGGFRTGAGGTGLPLVGTIDYRTGIWSITWDTAAPVNVVIGARYDLIVIDMGGGPVPGAAGTYVLNETAQPSDAGGDASATSADPGAQAILGPITRATVRVNISATSGGPFVAYDDGVGGWLTRPRGDPTAAVVAGTIDYSTGAWAITIPAGTITAAATVKFSYVSAFEDQAKRALRGPGPQTLGAGGAFTGTGTVYTDPAAANEFNGSTYLDHTTGAFGFTVGLVPLGVGTQSFDLLDGGTMTAVYVPASIIGFGDGVETVFAGDAAPAPFRRQANRLLGFQGAQSALAGAGEPQVTFATLGASDTADHWTQNVALSTDPDNTLNFRTGVLSIQWTGAPLADEAVYVVAEEVVINVECLYPGDIGNERPILVDGFYIEVGDDPTLTGTLRLQVLFDGGVEESFGQATDIDALIAKVNDEVNGSSLISASKTDAATFLGVDVTAAQQCGLGGAFTMADVIGVLAGVNTTGLQLFANDETVPVNWLLVPGQWHRQVIIALQSLCEKKGRRCMAVIPSPDLDDPFKHRDYYNGSLDAPAPLAPGVASVKVPYPPLVPIDSRQLATISPWVQYFDSYANRSVMEPPDGELAHLVAVTPAPWFPVAGLRRGKLPIEAVRYSASRDDRDLIYGPVGNVTEIVNPIIIKVGRGPVLVGQRTAQRNPSHTDRINVNWTVNVIMNLLDLASQEFTFELNDSTLWRQVTAQLNGVLKPIIARRGLQDAFVVVDGTTTTPDDVDLLKLNGKIFIKPALAVEFITYDLILTPTGADFANVVVAG
jgi:hypothetical protein